MDEVRGRGEDIGGTGDSLILHMDDKRGEGHG